MADGLFKKYNELYGKQEHAFGGGKPMPLVEKLADALSGARILDAGAGQGRNTLFLIGRGFNVDAYDLSEKALEQLEQEAKRHDYSVTTAPKDITDPALDVSAYDGVLLSFVLHHVEDEKARELLSRWKEIAREGAVHAIATFTSEGDFYADERNKTHFYPAPEELEELYQDWNVLSYTEKETEALEKWPDGTPKRNRTAFLLAQKPVAKS